MQRTLVVYASRYGTTHVIAQALSLILGPARLCTVEDFRADDQDFDLYVIGGPVYGDVLEPRIVQFIADNAGWLRCKRVALFCTCLALDFGERYLKRARDILGDAAIWAKPIGGNVYLGRLTDEDRQAMESFCERVGLPFQDIARFDAEALVLYGLQLRRLRDDAGARMPADQLRQRIDDFLASHNTCTLCTCHKSRPRATPIEYTYHDGELYLLSEGGEKFANIMLNRNVSVAIYEPYAGMERLAGMQLTGEAFIVEAGSDEYRRILELKGLSYGRIAALPMQLHMIRVHLTQAEFLWSPFAAQGYDARQIYRFE
jgi:flavodoxin/uncharacterized protein YhbP (UPF0306 family)